MVIINSTQAFSLSKVSWKSRKKIIRTNIKIWQGKPNSRYWLKKATTNETTPPKILKLNCNTFVETLKSLFNETLITCSFHNNLKLADIPPVREIRENYRPDRVLLSIFNFFRKFLQKQIHSYLTIFLSPCLFSYRKVFSTQCTLLSLIENWKKYFT